MIRNPRAMVLAAAGAVAFVVAPALSQAAVDPAAKCQAAHNAIAGAYAACLTKAQAKFVAGGGTDTDAYDAATGKCRALFDKKWTNAEGKGGGACPSNTGSAEVASFIEDCIDGAGQELAGGSLPDDYAPCNDDLGVCDGDLTTCNGDLAGCVTVNCGNGYTDTGEACDGADLNGATCATLAPSTPYGTLACNGGCNYDTSGCRARFDASGATVIDYENGLEWEKKSAVDTSANAADAHDGDNTYTWTTGTNAANGSVFLDFLGHLNGAYGGGCYAGHCDWRLPTLAELETTAVACGSAPCVADAVFNPVRSGVSDYYWSGTTDSGTSTLAWRLGYADGTTGTDAKTTANFAIAVRSR